jgi:FkbM family methyltransferase
MAVNPIRRALEVLSADLVVKRRLPASVGGAVVVASPGAGGLRYLFRRSQDLDPTLFSVARALVARGDVVWDVGGNVGLFAAASAGLAGKDGQVYSFEPDADVCRMLQRTAHASTAEHARIHPICVAVTDSPGLVRFSIARRCRSANFLEGYGTTQTGGVATTRLVPALNLDCMLDVLPSPNVLKIDVEGAEERVLQGATRLLTSVRPLLFVEVASEHAGVVERFLRSNSYELFDGATPTPVHDGSGAPCDTVAIPSERPIPEMWRGNR